MTTAGVGTRTIARAGLPGDALLHPLAAAAVATLLVNDHVLKPMFATWWTGKLSDAAALVVVALVVQAVGELIGMPRGRPMLLASMIVSAATLFGSPSCMLKGSAPVGA